MKPTTYTLSNYKNIPQIKHLTAKQKEAIEVVGNVFPFFVSALCVDELIHWKDIAHDPLFKITFPQKEMLNDEHYKAMKIIIDHRGDTKAIERIASIIRGELDPGNGGSRVLEVQACVNLNRQAH